MLTEILGHLKTINFPFGTNGKLMVLDVPVLKHNRVCFSRMNHSKFAVKVYIITFLEW